MFNNFRSDRSEDGAGVYRGLGPRTGMRVNTWRIAWEKTRKKRERGLKYLCE